NTGVDTRIQAASVKHRTSIFSLPSTPAGTDARRPVGRALLALHFLIGLFHVVGLLGPFCRRHADSLKVGQGPGPKRPLANHLFGRSRWGNRLRRRERGGPLWKLPGDKPVMRLRLRWSQIRIRFEYGVHRDDLAGLFIEKRMAAAVRHLA